MVDYIGSVSDGYVDLVQVDHPSTAFQNETGGEFKSGDRPGSELYLTRDGCPPYRDTSIRIQLIYVEMLSESLQRLTANPPNPPSFSVFHGHLEVILQPQVFVLTAH